MWLVLGMYTIGKMFLWFVLAFWLFMLFGPEIGLFFFFVIASVVAVRRAIKMRPNPPF